MKNHFKILPDFLLTKKKKEKKRNEVHNQTTIKYLEFIVIKFKQPQYQLVSQWKKEFCFILLEIVSVKIIKHFDKKIDRRILYVSNI